MRRIPLNQALVVIAGIAAAASPMAGADWDGATVKKIINESPRPLRLQLVSTDLPGRVGVGLWPKLGSAQPPIVPLATGGGAATAMASGFPIGPWQSIAVHLDGSELDKPFRAEFELLDRAGTRLARIHTLSTGLDLEEELKTTDHADGERLTPSTDVLIIGRPFPLRRNSDPYRTGAGGRQPEAGALEVRRNSAPAGAAVRSVEADKAPAEGKVERKTAPADRKPWHPKPKAGAGAS